MSQVIPAGSACVAMLLVATAVTYADAAEDSTEAESTATQEVAEKITELSVPPSTHVEFPEGRPAWIEDAPVLEGDVHVWPVSSYGCDSEQQCEQRIKELQRVAVSMYIEHITGSISEEALPINDKWIEGELITDRYVGTCTVGDAKLVDMAIRMEFDAATRKKILSAYKSLRVKDRLVTTWGVVGMGFVGMVLLSGCLGVFSRRVQKREAGELAGLSL